MPNKDLAEAAGQEGHRCGKCEFFDPRRPDGGVNEDSGICRLKGPTVGHVATMVLGDDGETWEPKVEILTHWCAVDPEFDWCPEFRSVVLPTTTDSICATAASA